MRRFVGFALVSIVLCGFAACGAAPVRAGSVIRVPDDHATIQAALEAAAPGDSIHVRAGVYAGPVDFLGKDVRLLAVDGPDVTTIEGAGVDAVVKFMRGEGAGAAIEGFTLRNGGGHATAFGYLAGGGIFIESASPTIRGNVIVSNRAELGGGIYVRLPCSPLIEANRILDNTAARRSGGATGGGICCEDDATPLIRENEIRGNAAEFEGGGIGCTLFSRPTIENNVIAENRAFGLSALGAGIACSGGAKPTIVNNEICNGWAIVGGGISVRSVSVVLERNAIRDNSAYNGAGIYCEGPAEIRVAGCTVSGNSTRVPAKGGGMYFASCDVVLTNNIVVENVALSGMGLGNPAGALPLGGGGVYFDRCRSIVMVNNTVANNSSTRVGGVYIYGFAGNGHLGLEQPILINNVIWGNFGFPQVSPGFLYSTNLIWPFLIRFQFVPTIVRDCVIERGYRWPGAKRVYDVDPKFVAMDQGDYRLRLDSPCVDRGLDAALREELIGALVDFDFEGDDRVIDGDRDGIVGVDIGADEVFPINAARYGTTNAAAHSLADVLRINGQAGDRSERAVTVSAADSVLVEILAPPAGPLPARFVLYAWEDEPDSRTLSPQPRELGIAVFPTPLRPDPSMMPVAIWNNLGAPNRLGEPTDESLPAPSVVLSLASASVVPDTLTFQGIIEDAASAARGPASLTNAVVLRIDR